MQVIGTDASYATIVFESMNYESLIFIQLNCSFNIFYCKWMICILWVLSQI